MEIVEASVSRGKRFEMNLLVVSMTGFDDIDDDDDDDDDKEEKNEEEEKKEGKRVEGTVELLYWPLS